MKSIRVDININPIDLPWNDLRSMGFLRVRFPLRIGSRYLSTEEGIASYRVILDELRRQRMTAVLVVNQETYGNGEPAVPWDQPDRISWAEYAEKFSERLSRLVMAFNQYDIIWQIWNEGDINGKSSVQVAPENYAILLNGAIKAIRGIHANARIITQGHAAGVGTIVRYWGRVLETLGTMPRVDAFAIHPYTIFGKRLPSIPGNWTLPFSRYMSALRSGVSLPIVVTEWGFQCARPSYYEAAGNAILDMWQEFSREGVQWAMWFGIHDGMEEMGLRDYQNRDKQFIADAVMGINLSTRGIDSLKVRVLATSNMRIQPSTSAPIAAVLRRGQLVEVNGLSAESLIKIVGNPNAWVPVIVGSANGRIRGFVRADLVSMN